MGNYPQKLKLPTAVNTRSRQNVGGNHITTANFMEFNVARAIELVPGQSLDVKHLTFSRLEPLVVPTFGGAEIRNRAFWVPYRTVFPAWNDFITDTRHQFDSDVGTANMQVVQHVPLISNYAFYTLFTSSEITVIRSEGGVPDFTYTDTNNNNNVVKRYLTPFGRYVYKLLRSLGYSFVFSLYNSDVYTAMPLLCVMRIFVDWYYPSQYAESAQVATLYSYLNSNKVPDSTSMFTGPQLLSIFQAMYKVSYDPSYLVSAWDSPSGPNYQTASSFSISDINNIGNGSGIYDDNVEFNGSGGGNIGTRNGAAIVGSSITDGPNKITQYALTALKSLSDYLKRHQLAGSRALDRYLARFGYKLPSEKLNRSSLIESYMQRIDFFDVTSTSSTEDASLGSFAGKGVSYGDGSFKVDTNGEYGMLIIISTIIPDDFHWQGIHRHTLHKSRLDFFTPEFDALGVQAISKAEAFVPMSNAGGSSTLNTWADDVFGFSPRYAEYKMGFSQITGDYALPSQDASREAWTMGRDLTSLFESDTPASFVHDINFVTATDSTQYDRIFQYQGDAQDKFNIIHRFMIQSSFPGRSMYDDYEFRDEDKSKSITVDVNGSTVN